MKKWEGEVEIERAFENQYNVRLCKMPQYKELLLKKRWDGGVGGHRVKFSLGSDWGTGNHEGII